MPTHTRGRIYLCPQAPRPLAPVRWRVTAGGGKHCTRLRRSLTKIECVYLDLPGIGCVRPGDKTRPPECRSVPRFEPPARRAGQCGIARFERLAPVRERSG